MFIATASACAVTMVRLLHSCEKYLQKPPLTLPSSRKYLHQTPVRLPASPFRPSSISLNSPTSKYPFFPMAASPLIINRNPSVTIISPKPEDRSSGKVRIRCRFGGKLMPLLSDGTLHYVGGQTYITDFRRDTTLQELYYRMEDIYGGPAVIRYKLSDQNLDTLVSIVSTEDLDNMLDEYDCLLEAPEGRYTRLEVFLFPRSNRENSLAEFNDVACNNSVGEDNIGGSTSSDGKGNDNTLVPENQSFSTHSSINEEKYVAPQIVNPPYDMPYISPTYNESHRDHYITPFPFSMSLEHQPKNCQDLRNISGPSNNALYFGHFRLTQVFLFHPSNRENSLAEFNDVACNNSVGEGNIEGSTSSDGKRYDSYHLFLLLLLWLLLILSLIYFLGNDNNSVPKNQSFSTHSSINEEKNVAPQIVNPPYDMPYNSPIYNEPHQDHYITPFPFSMSLEHQPDPWISPGPSNNASHFGHFRLTQDSGTNEVDEDLQNLVELVESVLQSP
ncbi:hypothetical protein M5K25_008507 [Dendrobium thyrsiflorum]|uniref:PB1 domain-containing protein n=1 Tax=Dendrobium thyrsiflorum TaxID=117978 RepID=A0ABD0V935_DENTH